MERYQISILEKSLEAYMKDGWGDETGKNIDGKGNWLGSYWKICGKDEGETEELKSC